MAASREKGAGDKLKEGGSTRVHGLAVRRRLRMPMRLFPRVGDRPAGAERGELRATFVLSFAAGDLGFSMERGRAVEEYLSGLETERASFVRMRGVEEALVRT